MKVFGGTSFLIALLINGLMVAAFDAPSFQTAEEIRYINNNYHVYVDDIVVKTAFKWFNSTSGTVNPVVLAEIQSNLTAYLKEITTTDFRQCDRLNSACFICENGAANVAAASVSFLVAPKLLFQKNIIADSVVEKIGPNYFSLLSNVYVPIITATPACRANSTCFPGSFAEGSVGQLTNLRKISFRRDFKDGHIKLLIHRINTGARMLYYSEAEGRGIRLLSVNQGEELVPEFVMNSNQTGVFCLPTRQKNEKINYKTFGPFGMFIFDDLPKYTKGKA